MSDNPIDLIKAAELTMNASQEIYYKTQVATNLMKKLHTLSQGKNAVIKFSVQINGLQYDYSLSSDNRLFALLMEYAIEDTQKQIDYYRNIIQKGLASHPLSP